MSARPVARAEAFDRRAALAKLHIARKELALADDSYRAILARVAGISSAGQATDRQLLALLAEMRRFGWKDKPPAHAAHAEQPPHVRKIWALWKDMAPLLRDASDQALFSFCLRQTGRSRPEWLDGARANKLIEALKAWRARLDAQQATGARDDA